MENHIDPRLSWAVYAERLSDDDYDLAAVMPAGERLTQCPAPRNDFREETLAYHLAHELAAALQYDGEGAVIVSSASGDFADVLIGDGWTSAPMRPRIFGRFWRKSYHVN